MLQKNFFKVILKSVYFYEGCFHICVNNKTNTENTLRIVSHVILQKTIIEQKNR